MSKPNPKNIATFLRRREHLPDKVFDLFMPEELQLVSSQYWTPIGVVERVVDWLEEEKVKSLVDIGSGSGKFCVVAALMSDLRVFGIEQRPKLVQAARALASEFSLQDRVTFIEGVFGECEVPEADAYYLFNPFGENLFDPDERLDEEVELSKERYNKDLKAMLEMLANAKLGTLLVTYNGFGGRIPSNYSEVNVDRSLRNIMRMWRKTERPDDEPPHSANGL